MTTKKLIILAVTVPFILGALGTGGYFTYNALVKQEATNKKDLEKFGLAVIPQTSRPPSLTADEQHEIYRDSTGILGGAQKTASFPEEKLSATEKVIRSLILDKKNLIAEQQVLRNEMATLHSRIAELEEYRQLNKHFAPETIAQELVKVRATLKKYLLNAPSAARFNNRQIDIMSAASATEYDKFIRRNRLILSDFQRDELVNLFLPEFAFCLGDGIDVATNSAAEERNLARFFEKNDISLLKPALRQDLDTILKPCQSTLHEQLATYTPKK